MGLTGTQIPMMNQTNARKTAGFSPIYEGSSTSYTAPSTSSSMNWDARAQSYIDPRVQGLVNQLPMGGGRDAYGNPWMSVDARIGQQQAYNSFNNALGTSLANHGLDFANLGLARGQLQANYGFENQQRDLDRANLSTSFGFDQRNQASDLASLALRRQQNMLGLQSNDIERGQIAAQRGFAGRDLNSSLAEAMDRGIRAQTQNNEDRQAAGGFFAPGTQRTNDEILRDTRYAGDRARLGYDQTMSGLSARESKLGLDDQQVKLSDQILAQQANQLGIKGDELKARYQQGLAKLGLDSQISASDLAYKMSHGTAQEIALWQQIAQEVSQAVGMDVTAGDIYARMMGG